MWMILAWRGRHTKEEGGHVDGEATTSFMLVLALGVAEGDSGGVFGDYCTACVGTEEDIWLLGVRVGFILALDTVVGGPSARKRRNVAGGCGHCVW